MIKEAIDYLAKLQTPKNPTTVEVHGQPYTVRVDGTIGELIHKPDISVAYPSVVVQTLSAFVAAYSAVLSPETKVAIIVGDPFDVRMVAVTPDEFGNRGEYVIAEHKHETNFTFNTFYDPEAFLIDFRAGFYFNDEAVKVQQLCSTLEAGSTVNVSDDGISQRVVITADTINKSPVTLPAEGIPLIPWRTFRDAAPVESKFLLRMKTVKDSLPRIALFEIDQKWRLDTIGAIRNYLREQLPEATIIA